MYIRDDLVYPIVMLRAWRLRGWAGPRLSLARAESLLIPEPKSTELKIGGIESRGMSQKRYREFRAENDAVKDKMIRLALVEAPVQSCRIRACRGAGIFLPDTRAKSVALRV